MQPKLLAILFSALLCSYSFAQTTFKVCDLPVQGKLYPADYTSLLTAQLGEGIEDYSPVEGNVVNTDFHPFVNAVHHAYATHRPLVISPDMIWLLIAQGFAVHVDQNGEKLRDHFVQFEGKKVLKVYRDFFVKGSDQNDWEGVFPEFASQIADYTGPNVTNAIVQGFTTTGSIEKAAFEVTLMDAMSSYFIYAMYTDCGITEVTLEGTPEDWKQLRNAAIFLEQYDLKWWIDELRPILDQLVQTSEGNVDKTFWGDIYKHHQMGSGGPYNTGWLNKFFPYRRSGEEYTQNTNFEYMMTDNYPSGMGKADMYWFYFGTCFQMELLAGFTAVTEDPTTHTLRPIIGWAIRDTGEQGIKEEDEKYREELVNPGG